MCGETTSKLSGPATSIYEVNYPLLFYVENTKKIVYVESPPNFNIFFLRVLHEHISPKISYVWKFKAVRWQKMNHFG